MKPLCGRRNRSMFGLSFFHREVKLQEFHAFTRVNEGAEVQIRNFIEEKDLRTAQHERNLNFASSIGTVGLLEL